jgi:hypothetical protein
MASVFTLQGPELGEDQTWFRRHPWIAATVMLVVPLGILVVVGHTMFTRKRGGAR